MNYRLPNSPYHRGSISTALIKTCKQIHYEAHYLPLTLNRLSFRNPLSAYVFCIFDYSPTTPLTNLITSIDIEYSYFAPNHVVWQVLIAELAKRKLKHLGLTIAGGIIKQSIFENEGFIERFLPLRGSLTSVDMRIGSDFVTRFEGKDCVEWVRRMLLRGGKT